ncbi:16S rRNA (cytosine(967)-C(5))-methyltransferase RsmB [Thiosulfativibrio zosterae]|uniref:16S rRNA (cytosine(967)-C(5))-methyltransferase n=1 Tax=Thiosulfativibrio zosterae TaxID=2675053 RepID=A0A6F8PQF0_9GAMM|nr:16S rRNA (cytosine(967)-C(5))-methyltransferase RsmB [Thiosulfativibrio zosterae]BBP44264.1 ribosomal RNA small subunit methyltransferase B [Thiosulfativibrio zosterae]
MNHASNAPKTKSQNPRLVALRICLAVVQNGRSLSQALGEGLAVLTDRRDRGFAQNLVLGTLRWQLRLEAIRDQLLSKPLKAKDEDVNQLILLGLYQLIYLDTPQHAAVSETVALTAALKKPWAKALLNGLLRNFIRDAESLFAAVDVKPAFAYSHPQWFTKKIREAYPNDWQSILTANNEPAPLTLRINPLVQSRESFLASLHAEHPELNALAHPFSAQGILLEQSTDVSQLPYFEQGGFSVQDGAAQQAGYLLNPQAGERILDACAAPGGKTTHLGELSNNQARIFALEKEPERLERLQENLARLGITATAQTGDASLPDTWWDGELFDKILLDAPCSATGIIRRHPDIKWHRTPEDISALTQLQANILAALWPLLKPGGQMLYATCSVLPDENTEQMQSFLAKEPSASQVPMTQNWGRGDAQHPGKQILPGEAGMDGFYYCLLQKS